MRCERRGHARVQSQALLLGIELFEDRQRPLGIGDAENQQALLCRGHRGEVAVVDVDFSGGEDMARCQSIVLASCSVNFFSP